MRLGKRIALATFVVVASHVGGFVLVFIVPEFKRRWDGLGVRSPPAKLLVVQVSDFMQEWWLVISPFIFLAAVLFVVMPLLRSRPTARSAAHD